MPLVWRTGSRNLPQSELLLPHVKSSYLCWRSSYSTNLKLEMGLQKLVSNSFYQKNWFYIFKSTKKVPTVEHKRKNYRWCLFPRFFPFLIPNIKQIQILIHIRITTVVSNTAFGHYILWPNSRCCWSTGCPNNLCWPDPASGVPSNLDVEPITENSNDHITSGTNVVNQKLFFVKIRIRLYL